MSETVDENNKESFGKKILECLDKGVVVSKKGLKNAGNAIGEFGDKSVLKIELSQLNTKLDKLYLELGKAVDNQFITDSACSVTKDSECIKNIVEKIEKIKINIEKHENDIKNEKK